MRFAEFLLIGMVYFRCHLVNPHVQAFQNKYGKGGIQGLKVDLWPAKVDPYIKGGNYLNGIQNLPSIGSYSKKMFYFLIFLATRILPASPNFGQAKHGQNGPAATDCQQCICYPICGHHFTHRTHTDISFRFRPGGRRLKNFRFSRIFISLW